jgi:hypothetical protein
MPVIVMVWVGPLPYLRETTFLERIAPWTITTALVAALMVAGARMRPMAGPWAGVGGWRDVLTLIGAFGFAALVSAMMSPTFWGALMKITPGSAYRSVAAVEDVDRRTRRRRAGGASVDIDLRHAEDNRRRYLELSERFFGEPRVEAGDVLTLRGKQNLLGVYVESVERTRAASGQPALR